MKIGLVVFALGAMLFALYFTVAEAQQPGKVARIGVISDVPASLAPHYQKAFRQGLRELGYVEGQNIAIEHRLVEGRYEHVPQLVADLLSLKTDVIVTSTIPT